MLIIRTALRKWMLFNAEIELGSPIPFLIFGQLSLSPPEMSPSEAVIQIAL